MASVLAMTWRTCSTWVGELTSIRNHCRPTNSLPPSPRAGR